MEEDIEIINEDTKDESYYVTKIENISKKKIILLSACGILAFLGVASVIFGGSHIINDKMTKGVAILEGHLSIGTSIGLLIASLTKYFQIKKLKKEKGKLENEGDYGLNESAPKIEEGEQNEARKR